MLNPPHCQTDGSELSVPIHTPGHRLQNASRPQHWETDWLAPIAHTEKNECLLILVGNLGIVEFFSQQWTKDLVKKKNYSLLFYINSNNNVII